ncbi:hypothetical protein BV22DRAFT_1052337 [Leucogyrophana mollusca]|uniref:Uncharacterized protein n=1 Tax=Leucogyrophana mollusca TaxID=85980 RepID=A0ACB8AW21_9AGAM|nr:hypothetical protein BV22DRAFT_1052337 [Leucogyrophana mollusca]
MRGKLSSRSDVLSLQIGPAIPLGGLERVEGDHVGVVFDRLIAPGEVVGVELEFGCGVGIPRRFAISDSSVAIRVGFVRYSRLESVSRTQTTSVTGHGTYFGARRGGGFILSSRSERRGEEWGGSRWKLRVVVLMTLFKIPLLYVTFVTVYYYPADETSGLIHRPRSRISTLLFGFHRCRPGSPPEILYRKTSTFDYDAR